MPFFEKVKKFIKTEDEGIEPKPEEEKKEKPEEEKPPAKEHFRTGEKKAAFGALAWVLKSQHVSEKATNLAQENQYVFRVSPKANKIQIRNSVEAMYGVHVERVSVIKIPAKQRRVRGKIGYHPGHTKAVVKIKKGESIAPVT